MSQISAFSEMKETELFEVGSVSEESFFNDIHAAVETGEGAPPKAEPAEPIAPEPDPLGEGNATPPPSGPPNPPPFFEGARPGQSIPANQLVSGEIAFALVDKALPIGLAYVLSMLDVKASSKELQATAAEKKTIIPVLERAMEELKVNFDNPWIALGAVLFAIYGGKAAEIYMTREKEPKIASNSYTEAKKGRGRPRKS